MASLSTKTTRIGARGGRLHRPGDPRAGPRDADLTGRATASVRCRTAASRGETNGRTAPTQAVPWHDRSYHSGVLVPAMPMPRAQKSRRARRDDCIARTMRKPARASRRRKRRAAAFLRPETPGSPAGSDDTDIPTASHGCGSRVDCVVVAALGSSNCVNPHNRWLVKNERRLAAPCLQPTTCATDAASPGASS